MRGRLDHALDWVRLQIDGFPARGALGNPSPVRYQPIPELGRLHQAFDAARHPATRTLYAVVRASSAA